MFVCKLTDSIFMVAMQRDFYIHLYLNNRKYMSIRAFVCSNCSVDRTFTRIFFLRSRRYLKDMYFIESYDFRTVHMDWLVTRENDLDYFLLLIIDCLFLRLVFIVKCFVFTVQFCKTIYLQLELIVNGSLQ